MIADLARSFPTLRLATGLTPWDPEVFDEWALASAPGSGALHAARFVLAVWNSAAAWKIGNFDAIRALAAWDAAHRLAFVAWAERPWWP